MIRAGAKNHASVAVVVSPGSLRRGARRGRRRWLHARRSAAARRRGVRAHRLVRHRGRRVVCPGARRRRGLVAAVRRARAASAGRCFATARTRTRRQRSTSTRRSRATAWRRRSSCTASRCRTTTTSTPTPRCGPRTGSTPPAVAIIKHANPCGIAIGGGLDPIADAHAKAHACDPVSAFGGVIAANRPVTKGMAEQIAAVFTEVDRRAGVRAGRAGDPSAQARPADLADRGARRRRCRVPPDLRRRAGPDRRRASTSRVTGRPAGRWWPASRWTPAGWPISSSPGTPAAR